MINIITVNPVESREKKFQLMAFEAFELANVLKKRRKLEHTEQSNGVLDELESRGFVAQVTSRDKLQTHLKYPAVVYAGIDPTANYLHVGHLLPLLSLYHFHIRGHRVIPLIGGATGLVGDPSGRDTERPLSSEDAVEYNVRGLKSAISNFFVSADRYLRRRAPTVAYNEAEINVKNNLSWFKKMNLLEFLRDTGVHARVNTMIARDSVQSRLSSQQGISFTEFTYQLLQAYDFLYLHQNYSCSVQIGGSDQWGNIISGIDLINRVQPLIDEDGKHLEQVYGITTPLLTTASGAKFGKSAGNAVTLDAKKTSIFDFYQFFLRVPDAEVGKYLKMFTLLPVEMIEARIKEHEEKPEARLAQRLLAAEVTELVHGESAVRRAEVATQVLYYAKLDTIESKEVFAALKDDPRLHFEPKEVAFSQSIAKLAVSHGLIASNTAAKQLVASKGLYVNNKPVESYRQTLTDEDLLGGECVILRSGSQQQIVLGFTHK
ncbi:tyrosyl-tRNA synthetase [Steccherinum ochraceum]|uniref:Tyrosine--tRNA ligase n=1 Tax=Steccherinum ochraceum TaxID=92696 RepID=A0A4R0RZA3_9APHY|nr:tyrosyl-tRNA synthetase [Steccherinum ochraceum]